jgi:hypothetical protein
MIELRLARKKVVFGAVILMGLDMFAVASERQIRAVDDDVLQDIGVQAVGQYSVWQQVLDFVKATEAVRVDCD